MTLAISAFALLISIGSIAVSTTMAVRQQRLSRSANHIPTMSNLMAEFRSPKFHDAHRTVMALPKPQEAGIGFSDLPDEERDAFVSVVYFYQMIATQIAMGVLNEEVMLARIRARIVAIWDAVEPYVEAERLNNPYGDKHMLSLLEYYAGRARRLPDDSARTLLSPDSLPTLPTSEGSMPVRGDEPDRARPRSEP
ncbi:MULTISPECIES: DUF4760 domain-containing protein [Nocardia]|uniref:DUF4760 domain-containing protein n=1 Tax=Nocardia nova TaxID=37330 RepID=A0A2T2YT58_9NOCA|nr:MULTISPECIES: DUF4760 domain-containing protein [Nocardia]PSR58705.1 hypothetical protein C8259_29640 [Nocardia nova]